MPRSPNYAFDKKERERLKNAKKAARANDKAKPVSAEPTPEGSSERDQGRKPDPKA